MNPPTAAVDTAAALAPIVLDTIVPCPPDRAFDYFTRDIGRWWPLERHSCGEADALDVRLEPRQGGRIVESTRSGATHVWGTLTEWQLGRRVAFTWHPGRDAEGAQWVDVTFAPNAAGTRVTLTHGGFEKLGARAAEVRTAYANGWPTVFAQGYAGYCRRASEEAGS